MYKRQAPTFGDPDRLQQVAVNLIANAIKFTPAGGTITVRTAVTGGRAVLEVSDTGPGIRADEIAHVFERFWRGTNGATASGSGIGLAVVAELVTAHHGDVHATNNDTAGVCFTVSLPLESRDHTATGD